MNDEELHDILLNYKHHYPESFVYFISDGEYIKIGVAKNFIARLKSLQTANARKLEILFLIPCKNDTLAHLLENELHLFFADYRLCGEWFDIFNSLDILPCLKYYTIKETVINYFNESDMVYDSFKDMALSWLLENEYWINMDKFPLSRRIRKEYQEYKEMNR